MSLALHLAHVLIQNKFQALALTHLVVRMTEHSLYIYTVEENEEAYRAALTPVPGNRYLLSVANHRGQWQPTPYVGEVTELVEVLTKKFLFALVRWS